MRLFAPQFLVLWAFLGSALAVHFRGKVRLGFFRQLTDHSTLMAPYNVLMYLFSAVPNRPILDEESIPELKVLRANWEPIRAEAMVLFAQGQIKAADKYNDWGFNSFFRTGWKRFYLKWYGAALPSALANCPKTVELLNSIPNIKGAMFATLPPGVQGPFPNDEFGDVQIKIFGLPFTVVGLYQDPSGLFADEGPKIVVPHTTFVKSATFAWGWLNIAVFPKETATQAEAMDQVTAALRIKRGLKPGAENNFDLISGDKFMESFNDMTAGFFLVMLVLPSVVLVVGVALWFLVPRLLGAIGIGGTDNPVSNPTTNVCPRISGTPTASANAHPNDGRVYGGKLSYPLLGSPWEAPEPEYRVAFGRDAQSQIIVVEPNYDGTSSWVASVLVADLIAGDGFFGPEQGSKIVAKCIVGAFYGSAAVNRTDITNKATTVDGRAAWELEMHLTFNIPGLKTKGETAIVVIVSTGTDSASIYYASIPDTVPQYLQPARDLIPQLKVSP